MASIYKIEVRKKGPKFYLYNMGFVCGGRLYKGDDPKNPKGQWPFGSKPNWMICDKKAEAVIAAAKLQTYLEAREAQAAKKKKGE